MKHRTAIASRLAHLAPAVLLVLLVPALCGASLSAYRPVQPAAIPPWPAPDLFAAVYGRMFSRMRPFQRHCAAPIGIYNGDSPCVETRGMVWNAGRGSDSSSLFNFQAFYSLKGPMGAARRRIPALLPSCWGPGHPLFRPDDAAHGEPFARADGTESHVRLADLVRANLFKIVALAQQAW